MKAHPRIGGSASPGHCERSSKWSRKEQSAVSLASEEVTTELQRLNDEYFDKHGFVFLICATGKSGEQMLKCLRERVGHSTEKELDVARSELAKIAEIRWSKVLAELREKV